MIRPVNLNDTARIIEIYSPHILHGVASFENEVPSIEEFQRRISENTLKFPWLVYESNGVLAGYAYGSSHKSRCAYEWTAEASVYVDQQFHRKGVGRALYTELFKILKDQGVVNILAGITLPNNSSVTCMKASALRLRVFSEMWDSKKVNGGTSAGGKCNCRSRRLPNRSGNLHNFFIYKCHDFFKS